MVDWVDIWRKCPTRTWNTEVIECEVTYSFMCIHLMSDILLAMEITKRGTKWPIVFLYYWKHVLMNGHFDIILHVLLHPQIFSLGNWVTKSTLSVLRTSIVKSSESLSPLSGFCIYVNPYVSLSDLRNSYSLFSENRIFLLCRKNRDYTKNSPTFQTQSKSNYELRL